MTDQTSTPSPADPKLPRCRGRARGALFILLLLLAAGLTGAFAHRAYSQVAEFGPAAWHGGGFMTGPVDPARVEGRVDRMMRHLAVEVDATAEQQDKLRTIAKAAVKDLLPMREKAIDLRQRGRDLLTAATIDRTAIESLRGEHTALADQASRRFSQALADAASVLTPEQRRKVADIGAARRAFMHRWHRG